MARSSRSFPFYLEELKLPLYGIRGRSCSVSIYSLICIYPRCLYVLANFTARKGQKRKKLHTRLFLKPLPFETAVFTLSKLGAAALYTYYVQYCTIQRIRNYRHLFHTNVCIPYSERDVCAGMGIFFNSQYISGYVRIRFSLNIAFAIYMESPFVRCLYGTVW